MKRAGKFCIKCLLLVLIFLNQGGLFAQKNKLFLQNNYAPQSLLIDGLASEWPSDLLHENIASKLQYAVANNESTLFLVVKSSSSADLQRLLLGGISFSVNFTGEKKNWQTITFPLMPRKGSIAPAKPNKEDKAQRNARIAQELRDLKEIGVNGFEQLLDGKIAVINDYGIRVAAGIDESGLLVCEYALPMKLLHSDAFKSDNFACEIKVNGLNINSANRLMAQNFNRRINAGRPIDNRVPEPTFLEPTGFKFYCSLASKKDN